MPLVLSLGLASARMKCTWPLSLGAGGDGRGLSRARYELNRDVAIKILPDAFADDADRARAFHA